MNSVPKAYLKNTTFTKRPVITQIISYIVFAVQTILFYSIVIHHLESTLKIIMLSLYTISLVSLVLSSIVCSQTDPSDQIMIAYRNQTRKEFDDYKSKHNQKFLFCDHCNSYVKQRSRHCRVCDRCTQNFDHHCMWINNCVGDLNYKSFFIMIISAFTNLLFYVITLCIVTSKIKFQQYIFTLTISWISGSINLIFVILLVNLICLHLYLNYKGLSTFQFILAQRMQENKNKQNEQKRIHPLQQKNSNEQPTNEILNDKKDNELSQNQDIKIANKFQVNNNKINNNEQEQSDHSEAKHKRQTKKFIIFGENEVTQKSESCYSGNKSNKPIIGQQNENEDQSQQNSNNMQLSQLFTRNKSLKIIIGTNQCYIPHKLKNKDKIELRQTKSKSMFSHAKRLK